ncbi:hypothetical protein ACL03H_11040 [Saccharopolyspora sp. MS10]|uniref:hypothetical protein n=1 Tax=Saccharopolyspora sp. MS10 TaxID=3385973 RepID=UPI0039A34867
MSTGSASGGRDGSRRAASGPVRGAAGARDALRAGEEIDAAIESARRAEARGRIPGARGQPVAERAEPTVRDALLDVAVRGHRLAHALDDLALRYATPGTARPAAAHVALDQAAAAAEDLGNCVRDAVAALGEPER